MCLMGGKKRWMLKEGLAEKEIGKMFLGCGKIKTITILWRDMEGKCLYKYRIKRDVGSKLFCMFC